MSKQSVNDMTDAFDTRLQALDRNRAPKDEVDAAITVYERMRTARAICQALFPAGFSDSTVATLALEIGALRQSGQFVRSRE